MSSARSGTCRVVIWTFIAEGLQDAREESFDAAAALLLKDVREINKAYRTKIREVHVSPFDWKPGHPLRRGFDYSVRNGSRGLALRLAVDIVPAKAKRMSDKDLALDIARAGRLMVERVCWQASFGTYRAKHSRWEQREQSGCSVFPGLFGMQRGNVDWEMQPGGKTGEYECVVRSPRCAEAEWPDLAEAVFALTNKQRSLEVEDAGYIVPQRTVEFVIVGKRVAIERFVPKLLDVFHGRKGTTARVRLSMSEERGTVHRVG